MLAGGTRQGLRSSMLWNLRKVYSLPVVAILKSPICTGVASCCQEFQPDLAVQGPVVYIDNAHRWVIPHAVPRLVWRNYEVVTVR